MMAYCQVGALNHMYGRKHSMETIMKMKEAHRLRHTPEPADEPN
jgi:hypothetical protein